MRKCLDRWEAHEYSALWKEAVLEHQKKRKQGSGAGTLLDEEKKAIRSELLVRQGEVSRGIAALTSAPMAPDNEETYNKLVTKHPSRLFGPLRQSAPSSNEIISLTVNEDDVRKAIQSFKRGSSGGTMALRAEHIQAALFAGTDTDVHPLESLTKLANHLLAGKAPVEAQQYYAGARLCALQKGQNDVRPIAAGETLRRMVSKTACSVVKSKASTLFQGRQYGVATASGSERVIHLCRQVVESTKNDPEFVLCKVDLRNAFNTVSRAAFISLSEKHFPELTPWINWCYSTDSALTYGSQTVASTEGVQQGDPLGPLLFSMVLREITELIENEVPSGLLLHLWYLDDGVLAGKCDSVRRALDAIACAGPQWGLHLNASKCEIISHPVSSHCTDSFTTIPARMKNHEGNFSILGSPVGSEEFCIEYLREFAIEPAEATLKAIGILEDPQVALTLIRHCAGFCQLVYSLRTTPPKYMVDLCQRLDNAVLRATELILCPLDAPARAQIQRDKRHGGFGLRSSVIHSSAAYVSSAAFAGSQDDWAPSEAKWFSEAVERVNRQAGKTLVDSTTGKIQEALIHKDYNASTNPLNAHHDHSLDAGMNEKLIIPRQKHLCREIGDREFSSAYEAADFNTRARLISQTGRGAASWAFVIPSKERGYSYTPTEFRALSRWWLGADIYPGTRPCPMGRCQQPLGPKGDHAVSCKCGHGIMTRHNALACQFVDFCSKAHLAPQREVSLGNRGPAGAPTRPGDVVLPSIGLGKSLVLDFAVTHVQQPKYADLVRNANGVTAGSFAESYATSHKQVQRRDAETAGYDFAAMVVGSYGSWSDSALAVLKKVGAWRSATSQGTMDRGTATANLIRDLNVTLMRVQARMMVARMAEDDPDPPLLLN